MQFRSRVAPGVLALACMLVGGSAPAEAQLYGSFFDTTAGPSRQIIAQIDAGTGVATPIGSTTDASGSSSGVSATDEASGRLYFVANSGSGSSRFIWEFDLATETVTSSAIISGTNLNPTLQFLEYDSGGSRLLAIATSTLDSSQRFLCTLDAATGVLTPIGSAFSAGGASSGVDAFDAANGVFYYVTNPSGASTRSIYAIDADTGVLLSSPSIASSGAVALNPTVTFLAYDPVNSTLLAVANSVSDSSVKYLATLNAATGALTAIGPSIAATFSSSGVDAFDAANGVFFAPISAAGASSSTRNLFQLDADDGSELASPLIATASATIGDSPNFLFFVPEPGAAPLCLAALATLVGLVRRKRARSAA